MRHKVARLMAAVELLQQDLLPGGATGVGGAGQAEDQGAVGHPGNSPALNGGGTYLLVRDLPEQLTEPFYRLVEQRDHRLRGGIPGGKAGAAGDQHHIHVRGSNPLSYNFV